MKFRVLNSGPRIVAATLFLSLPLPGLAAEPTADPPKRLEKVVVATDAESGYLETVTATASKMPRSRREVPVSVSVLTRAQMDAQGLVTTWDALQQITGVQAISNDNTQAQYYARGAALDIQHDGMPASMPLSGYQQFDLSIYDRIEVQRGPAGLLQGSGSFGGTVNFVRKRPTATRKISALASIGSWSNLRAEIDASSPLNASGSLRARAVASMIDREFVFDRIDDRKRLGYVTVEYDVADSTTMGAFAAWQDDDTPGFSGLPTYTNGQFLDVPRSFNPYPTWNRMAWETLDTGLELAHRFGNDWRLTAKISQRNQDFFFHDGYATGGVNPTTGVIANYARREFTYDYALDGVDLFLTGAFDAFGRRHEFLLGLNESTFLSTGRGVNPNQNATLNVPNVLLADPPAVAEPTIVYRTGSQSRTHQRGLYSQLAMRVSEPVTLVAGARVTDYDARSRSIAPATPTAWAPGAQIDREITPFAGIVWTLNERWSMYGSYADVFVPQTQRRVTGEVLDPRVGRQYEVGVKADLANQALHASAAVFNIRDRNRAYADPANTGFFIPLGEVESEGAEFEIVGRPVRNLELSTGYTYLTTKYLTHQTLTGQPLSYWYPKHSLKLWGSYSFGAGRLQGLRLGAGVNAYSRSASGTSTATVAARTQGGYAVASAQAAWSFSRTLQASLTLNNLFDREFYTRLGGTNTYNSFGEPLNAQLALRWSFQ